MRWKWVNIANTYWSRNPSWMFSQWCKGQQFEYYVALAGSTRHAVSVSDLQNTSDQHKTSQELVNLLSLPLLNLWPFTKPFQLSALPLGHETVCIYEPIFPGYRENTAFSFSSNLRYQAPGSSSSGTPQLGGCLSQSLITSPSIMRLETFCCTSHASSNWWQQLIVNFNQVVFCSCYGLWQEHDKAVHHLFKLSVAWV